MKETFSIKENRDFQRTYKKGSRKTQKYLIVYICQRRVSQKGEETGSRLGITVGKKFGNSVQRNTFKRFVREVFRSVESNFTADYDIVVAARSSERFAESGRKLKATYIPNHDEVKNDMLSALWALGVINAESVIVQ